MHRKYNLLVGLATGIYIVLFSAICLWKLVSFEYSDFDLAVYSQILYNLIRGSLYSSILGLNFLGHHAHFLTFLIAPLYAVFPHPFTLLFLQTLVLGLTAIPLYLIAKKELSPSLGFLVAFAYLAYPALTFTNLYEFHYTVFATFFLTLMLYALYKNNFFWFVVFMFLSLLCQENIALLIFMTGILAMVLKKGRRFVLMPIALSIIWLLFCFYLVIPYFNRGQIQFISFYSQWGNNPKAIAINLLSHPVEVFNYLFLQKENLNFIFGLFAPLGFVPFWGFEYTAAVLPVLLQHLLSGRLTEKLLDFHYAAEMTPFIFLGLIYGIKRMMRRGIFRRGIKLIMVCSILFGVVSLGPLVDLFLTAGFLKQSRLDVAMDDLVKKIPDDSGVVATFRFMPKLANRRQLFPFAHFMTGSYPFSRKKMLLPEGVRFALVDFDDPLMYTLFNRESPFIRERSYKTLLSFINNPEWGVVEYIDSMVLFERGKGRPREFFRILSREPRDLARAGVTLANTIELLGYEFSGGYPGFRVKLYWKCLKESSVRINGVFGVFDRNNNAVYIRPRMICHGAYPVFLWKRGEIIEDEYAVIIPLDLPPGEYRVILMFYGTDRQGRQYFFEKPGSDIIGMVVVGKLNVNEK
ncbi:MAG: DUF2079 domain-containing protein [Candidatus Omnitrophota bacterium]